MNYHKNQLESIKERLTNLLKAADQDEFKGNRDEFEEGVLHGIGGSLQLVELSLTLANNMENGDVKLYDNEDEDPSPYCGWCNAKKPKYCQCGPRAEND